MKGAVLMVGRRRAYRFLGTLLALMGLAGFGTEPGWAEGAGLTAERFVHDSGMTVALVESHANPMVEVRMLIRGGSSADPAGKEGLAELVAWMSNEGAADRDAEAFQERLAFHGIRLSAGTGRDALYIDMTTLTIHLDEAFALLGDALIRPRFDDDAFERAVADETAGLLEDEEDSSVQAARALYRSLYGEHPYAHPTVGSRESLPRIGVADVRVYRERLFRGPGMVMAVAGDLTRERLRALIATHLAGIDPRPADWSPPPPVEAREGGHRLHIPMDGGQTAIRMGRIGIDRHDPDYFPIVVMNHILGGGGLNNRLSDEIREARGLTYSVFSYLSRLTARGPMMIGMRTKNASVEEALGLIRAEVEKMARDGVTEEELEDARRYLAGSFPLRLDGLGRLADNWAAVALYDLGWDYLGRWVERIEAVSRGDVARAAGRLLRVEQFHTVTAGATPPAP